MYTTHIKTGTRFFFDIDVVHFGETEETTPISIFCGSAEEKIWPTLWWLVHVSTHVVTGSSPSASKDVVDDDDNDDVDNS